MSPRLYYSPGACSLAVHIVLEEIGDPYTLERVSIPEGAHQSQTFLGVNPKGRVPVLAVGDFVLTEAPAIMTYLAFGKPKSNLLPTDGEELARCLEWFNWLSSSVHAVAFAQIWRPNRFIDDAELFDQIIAKGRANAEEAFAYIEARLPEGTWAAGSTYRCLDPYLLVFYRWGNRIGVDMRERFPVWTAHAERVCDRPAVKAVLAAEGITVW
jgi:glutathione S-transferase